MNQQQLQHMANERLVDAQALVNAGRWAYAYYVAGYAVECALKSCVLSRMIHIGHVFDDWKSKGNPYRTHDFVQLIELAGLTNEHNTRLAASAVAGDDFRQYWNTVNSWTESSRYEERLEADAKALLEAIQSDPDGVLKWLKNYW